MSFRPYRQAWPKRFLPDTNTEEETMMDDRRYTEDRYANNGLGYPPADTGYTGPIVLLVAFLLIGGYFVVSYNSDAMRTASNNTPIERSAPAPTPPVTIPKQ